MKRRLHCPDLGAQKTNTTSLDCLKTTSESTTKVSFVSDGVIHRDSLAVKTKHSHDGFNLLTVVMFLAFPNKPAFNYCMGPFWVVWYAIAFLYFNNWSFINHNPDNKAAFTLGATWQHYSTPQKGLHVKQCGNVFTLGAMSQWHSWIALCSGWPFSGSRPVRRYPGYVLAHVQGKAFWVRHAHNKNHHMVY